jgi:protein SCO1/2
MKIGKFLLLLVLLGAPVLTYIFLKSFGKNYYDLPRFNPSAVTQKGDTIYATLPSELARDIFKSGKAIYIIHSQFDSCKTVGIAGAINRVQDFYQSDPAVAIVFAIDSLNIPAVMNKDFTLFDKDKAVLLRDFLFGFELPEDGKKKETISSCKRLTLMDGKGYIRGVYAIENMEEADRLILEVKVLKSQLN